MFYNYAENSNIRKFNSSILCFEELKKKWIKTIAAISFQDTNICLFSLPFFQKRNELFSNISVD